MTHAECTDEWVSPVETFGAEIFTVVVVVVVVVQVLFLPRTAVALGLKHSTGDKEEGGPIRTSS
jgi:hypothetical protein